MSFHKSISKGLEDIAGTAQDGLEDIAGTAQDGLEDIAGTAQDGLEDIAGTAQDGLEDIAGTAQDGLEDIAGTAQDGLNNLAGTAQDGLEDIAGTAQDGLNNLAGTAQDGLEDLAQDGLNNLAGTAQDGLEDLAQDGLEGLTNFVEEGGKTIDSFVNTIGEFFYTAGQLAEIAEDISSGDYDSAFQTAGDMVGGPTGDIVSSFGELLEGDIGAALIEAGAGVGEVYEYELAGSALVIAGHLYNEDSTGVINELDSLTGGNLQQFSSDIQNVENDVINELDSLTGGNFQLFSSVVQNVEDGNYVEAFMDMAPILVQLGDETSGYVGEGLATFGEILQYDIGGAVERASRTVGSIYGGPIGEELAGAVGSVLGDALSDSLSNFLA